MPTGEEVYPLHRQWAPRKRTRQPTPTSPAILEKSPDGAAHRRDIAGIAARTAREVAAIRRVPRGRAGVTGPSGGAERLNAPSREMIAEIASPPVVDKRCPAIVGSSLARKDATVLLATSPMTKQSSRHNEPNANANRVKEVVEAETPEKAMEITVIRGHRTKKAAATAITKDAKNGPHQTGAEVMVGTEVVVTDGSSTQSKTASTVSNRTATVSKTKEATNGRLRTEGAVEATAASKATTRSWTRCSASSMR